MDSEQTFIIKVPKKLKHNGIKRSLESNETTKKMIDEEINQMIKYLSAHIMCCKIRSFMTGQSCPVKKFFNNDMQKVQQMLEVETNYGTICLRSIISMNGVTVGKTREALERINIDPDKINMELYSKHRVNVNIDALKYHPDVIAQLSEYNNNLQKYIDECEILGDEKFDEDKVQMIKNIAARKCLSKDLYSEKKQYILHYNKMKDIFNNATTNESKFPRNYEYKGVFLGWDNNIFAISYPTLAKMYLQNYDLKNGDTKYEEFTIMLLTICGENIKCTLTVLLDDYDYCKD